MKVSATPPVDALRALVAARTGLDVTGRRADAFLAALERAAADAGAPSAEAHARALLDGDAPLRPMLEELAVGETWFFREPEQWRFVEGVVLPETLARRRGPGPRFRAWSAGCSTGEEPYSLAILLDALGLGDAVHVMATDLNETAVERARRAEFSVWSLRGGSDARVRRHLTARDGCLALDPAIAGRVRFSTLNLAAPEYPSRARGLADLDLVLCRNVLIYLDRALLPGIAERLFAALAPGGWLLLGASDPSLSALAPFELRSGAFGVAYQRPRLEAREEPRKRQKPSASAGAAGDRGSRIARRGSRLAARTVTATSTSNPNPTSNRNPNPNPTPSLHHLLTSARALLDAGRLADALHAADAALAVDPLSAAAWFEKAVALSELSRPDDAEAACGRALYLAPGEPFAHFFIALLRLRRGDRASAGRSFATAAALASRRPPEAPLAFSHGLTSGEVAGAARAEAARLAGASPPIAGR